MSTQHTPYDADVAEALALEEHRHRIGGKSASGSERERIGKELGRQEGYRQAVADYAPLLEAVRQAEAIAALAEYPSAELLAAGVRIAALGPLLRAAIEAVEGRNT